MTDTTLYDYLERIASLMRAWAREQPLMADLQPIQLSALNYLARCNRYSNTPLGVTDFLGLTKGTVSQSLKALEAKGLIEKRPDALDRRSVHLELTEEGRGADRCPGAAGLPAQGRGGIGRAQRGVGRSAAGVAGDGAASGERAGFWLVPDLPVSPATGRRGALQVDRRAPGKRRR